MTRLVALLSSRCSQCRFVSHQYPADSTKVYWVGIAFPKSYICAIKFLLFLGWDSLPHLFNFILFMHSLSVCVCRINKLGSGSDFEAYFQRLGIASGRARYTKNRVSHFIILNTQYLTRILFVKHSVISLFGTGTGWTCGL